MNRELLARVRDRIAEVGNEHCDMDNFAKGGTVAASGAMACGTTACIAGYAIAMSRGAYDISMVDEPADVASDLLGFSSNQPFYVGYWPYDYVRTLQDEGDAKGMLAVCDALLDGSITFDEDGNLIEAPED